MTQPPSGGCVLKHLIVNTRVDIRRPAAFRRLCVETKLIAEFANRHLASRLQAAVC